MPWTAPPVYVTNELMTAGKMNLVSDNFRALIGDFCYAYHNTTQNVSAGNTDALNLNSELFDSSALHDVSTNNSRITVGVTGKYFIHGRSSVSNNNNGTGTLHLYKNGSPLTPAVKHGKKTAATDWEDEDLQVTTIVQLTAGDYVELYGQAETNTFTFDSTQMVVHGPLAAGN